jgi:Ca-activated chloride channel family protein
MTKLLGWMAVAGWLLAAGAAAAPLPDAAETKTLSPYFLLKGGGDGAGAFPLESTDVDVQVAGVIAEVTVRQLYRNAGPGPIEALYVFPASTRAAVQGLTMTIGDRVVKAVIKEREEARRTYEAAKAEGKTASLLEQQRPNVFQMNVANILPGDRIEVELRYSELLVPEDGVYELVYPTVVGPRYSNRPEAGAAPEHHFVANPYLRKGEPGPTRFTIAARVQAGLPVLEAGSPSHGVDVAYASPTEATVKLAAKETGREPAGPANRDFILRYRLQDAKIQTGLLLHRGTEESFFLLMVQPPQRVAPSSLPPREFVFIVDVSGSMNGFPIEVTKTLMKGLLGTLRPEDRFNLLLFAGSSHLLAPASLEATPDNVTLALHTLDRHPGSGGTELLPALDRALALPAGDLARSIVIVTDGYVDVEAEAFDRIRNGAGSAAVYAFGIGSAVNRHLIEGLAHAGHGEPAIVTGPAEAAAAVARFQRYVESPLLHDVEIDFGGLDVSDVEPAQVPMLTAERPLIVTGKWNGSARGPITVRGRQGGQPWSTTVDVPSAARLPALRALWARERLRVLSDFAGPGRDNRGAIVALGLEYGLLTRYTSFVAVDEVVRNTTGTTETVRQPLPLPQDVSELAVGAHAPGTPEPGTLLLLGVGGAAALRRLRRKRVAS